MTHNGKTVSIPKGIAMGASVNLLLTILGAVLLAQMVEIGVFQLESIGYWIVLLMIAASFVGTLVALFKTRRQKVAVCILSAAIYLLILLCITALFFGGQYEGVGVTSGLILAGSGTAGLLSIRKKQHYVLKKHR